MCWRPFRAALTVVAEESVWGDQVVIWPGPGIPQSLPIGTAQHIAPEAFYSLDCWRVSKATGECGAAELQSACGFSTGEARLSVVERDSGYRLDWVGPVMALAAVPTDAGGWTELELPAVTAALPKRIRLYTPLAAAELHR